MKCRYLYSDEDVLRIKYEYYKYYIVFMKYRNKEYKDFIHSFIVEDIYKEEPSISTLEYEIETIRKFSEEIANSMRKILDYQIAKRDRDLRVMFDMQDEIKNMKVLDSKQMNKSAYYSIRRKRNINYFQGIQTTGNQEARKSSLDKTIAQMKLVISENKPISEYSEEEKKELEKLRYRVYNNIEEINPEDYIKFMKLYKNLNPISSIELDQYLEVLEYFCKYLDENVLKFIYLDSEEEIRNFYISGEENLKDNFKKDISNLHRWKLSKIRDHQKYYHELKDLMYTFRESLNLEDLHNLEEKCKKSLKEDKPCIYEFYADIIELSRKYKEICGLDKASNSKREEIKEEFKKQMILRDN